MPSAQPEVVSVLADFEIDLNPAKEAELKLPAAWKLVLDLSQWFLMQSARSIMQIGDSDIADSTRAVIRRFWFERKTQVYVRNKHGWILVEANEVQGARVIDFQLNAS